MGSNKRGRPEKEGKLFEVRIHLRLRFGVDDDLIKFFSEIPKGKLPLMLKIALRSGQLSMSVIEDEIDDQELFDGLDGFYFD